MNTSTRTTFIVAAIALLICLGASAENKTGNTVSTTCATGKVTGPARGYLPHRCYRPGPNYHSGRSYGPGKGYGHAKGYIPGKGHNVGEHYKLGKSYGPCNGFKLG